MESLVAPTRSESFPVTSQFVFRSLHLGSREWVFAIEETDGGAGHVVIVRGAEPTVLADVVSSVALNADGTLMAYANQDGLVLIRRDGTLWPNGTAHWRATQAPWAQAYETPRKLTFLRESLLFAAHTLGTTESPTLFRVPLDGSSQATPVPLDVGGAPFPPPGPPQSWTPAPAVQPPVVSRDHSRTVFPLRSHEDAAVDLYLYEEGATRARNLSRAAEDVLWEPRLEGQLMRSIYPGSAPEATAFGCLARTIPMGAFSPDGSRFAYVEGGSPYFGTEPATVPRGALTIVSTTTGARQVVSTPERFDESVACFGGFHWATDDDLLFWAQEATSGLLVIPFGDLFHFRLSTGNLTNVTTTDQSAPYTASMTRPRGGAWMSREASRLGIHVIRRETVENPLREALFSVDLATLSGVVAHSDSRYLRVLRSENGPAWVFGRNQAFTMDDGSSSLPIESIAMGDVDFHGTAVSPDGQTAALVRAGAELGIARAGESDVSWLLAGDGFRPIDEAGMRFSEDGSRLVVAVAQEAEALIVEIDLSSLSQRVLYREPNANIFLLGLGD